MKRKLDYLVYCDESCPLEYEPISLFGAISCSADKKQEIVEKLRELKKKYFFGNSRIETKWVKVSKSRIEYYKELIEYFYKNDDIRIRIMVVKNKQYLDNNKYNAGDYQLWYYKMYYYLLERFLDSNFNYYMLYDEKDKYTTYRMNEVKRIVNEKKNFDSETRNFNLKIKQINSKESELMQLLDVIMGAVGYKNRGFMKGNKNLTTKHNIVKYIESVCNRDLSQKTSPFETKFNIFIWNPRITR